MRFGRHPAILGGSGGYAFIRALQPAAWFRADTGVTVTGSGASMVADQAESDNALVLPGVASNYASAPDSAPLSITGDIDIRVRVALDDWSPAVAQYFVSKWVTGGNQRSWTFGVVGAGGNLILYQSTDGSSPAIAAFQSSVATGLADGSAKWVRVTLDVDNGAAGRTAKFYLSDDGSAWTQLGSDVTVATAANTFDSSAAINASGIDAGTTQNIVGKLYRAIIKSGIDGTTVFDANFAAQTKGTTSFSESSSNAATVTVNQSGSLPAHIGSQKDLLQGTDASRPPYLSYTGTKYLYLPGVAGNYASTPDSVPASITGDIDIRVRVALDDWTPSAIQMIASKDSGGSRSWYFYVKTTGELVWGWSELGAVFVEKTSSVATGITDRAEKWVRVTFDVDNGAAGSDCKFWLSDDNSTYTQLGTTQTTAGVTSIFDNAKPIEIGSNGLGTANNSSGKFYRAIIKNGIDGTTVVDFNPDRDASDGSTSFASSATGETWTVNSSGGLPAQIVGRPSLLFDGSADYLKCNAFTLNQPETVYIAFKQVSYTVNDVICDGNTAGTLRILQGANSGELYMRISATIQGGSLALGAYGVASHVSNWANSVLGINLGSPATGDIGYANAGGFTLGSNATPGSYSNIQVLEVILFPAAHDATQRARVIQYLAGRHGIAL